MIKFLHELGYYLRLIERGDFRVLSRLILIDTFARIRKKNVLRIGSYAVWCFDYSALKFFFKEVFVKRVYDVAIRSKAPRIVDVGSNVGFSVVYFKIKYPDAKITAFEPDPDSFEMLRKNVEVNGFENVELNELALGGLDGELPFYRSDTRGAAANSLLRERVPDGSSVLVKVARLSRFLGDATIDLLKIDAEGSEREILRDLVESGKIAAVSTLVLEYHHNIGTRQDRLSELLSMIESSGFVYSIRGDFGKLGGFQDILIYATRS